MMINCPRALADPPDDRQWKTDPVGKRTAPLIRPLVGFSGDKLVEQVAFRAHHFDPIVAGIPASTALWTKSLMVPRIPGLNSRGRKLLIGALIFDGATHRGW